MVASRAKCTSFRGYRIVRSRKLNVRRALDADFMQRGRQPSRAWTAAPRSQTLASGILPAVGVGSTPKTWMTIMLARVRCCRQF